jgi:hypothetical protein
MPAAVQVSRQSQTWSHLLFSPKEANRDRKRLGVAFGLGVRTGVMTKGYQVFYPSDEISN